MKDYSKMSDFEITEVVAQLVLWKKKDCEEIHGDEKLGVVSWADGANWHVFDPCNNPSDAWPIIVENKICFQPDMVGDGFWHCMDCNDIHAKDKNPLRAAMIVYLMMRAEVR